MQVDYNNYVDTAEKVILSLKDRKDRRGRDIPIVTTSKIRNLLAMTADIYNEVMNQKEDKLSDEICSRIDYLRVRVMYEAGRESSVKDLVNEAGIVEQLKKINGSKKNFILFNRYMEALVAFRKYYVKNDD